MQNQSIFSLISILILITCGQSACQNSDFSGASRTVQKGDGKKDKGDDNNDKDNETTGKKKAGSDDDSDEKDGDDIDDDLDLGKNKKDEDDTGDDAEIAELDEVAVDTEDGVKKVGRCSPDYSVPGTANIYLAGTPNGTSISYNKGAPDRMPAQTPLLAVPEVKNCFKTGAKIYLKVTGEISHGSSAPTDADGKLSAIHNHEKHAWLGKSDIQAPLNSLVGVFLGDEDPSASPAPNTLNFGSQAERDYTTLSPKKGQVFFIGDGKNSSGKYQTIVVPPGVTRLYFGIMDVFEWNNNSGNLMGAILIEK